MEAITGETTSQGEKDRGNNVRRCPKCGRIIRIPKQVTDYICHNCFTKDDFNDSLLSGSALSFAGMRTTRGGKRNRKATKTEDRVHDSYLTF